MDFEANGNGNGGGNGGGDGMIIDPVQEDLNGMDIDPQQAEVNEPQVMLQDLPEDWAANDLENIFPDIDDLFNFFENEFPADFEEDVGDGEVVNDIEQGQMGLDIVPQQAEVNVPQDIEQGQMGLDIDPQQAEVNVPQDIEHLLLQDLPEDWAANDMEHLFPGDLAVIDHPIEQGQMGLDIDPQQAEVNVPQDMEHLFDIDDLFNFIENGLPGDVEVVNQMGPLGNEAPIQDPPEDMAANEMDHLVFLFANGVANDFENVIGDGEVLNQMGPEDMAANEMDHLVFLFANGAAGDFEGVPGDGEVLNPIQELPAAMDLPEAQGGGVHN